MRRRSVIGMNIPKATSYLEGKGYTISPIFIPDSAFSFITQNLAKSSAYEFTTDFDITDFELVGTDYYVDVATGNDSNTGLIAESPKKTIIGAVVAHGNKSPSPFNNAVVSRSDQYFVSPPYSWKVVTPGSVVAEGIKINPDPVTTIGDSYTTSVKVWAPTGATLIVVMGATQTAVTGNNAWQTITSEYVATSASHRSQVRTAISAQAITFYVDDFTCVHTLDGVSKVPNTYMSTADPLIIYLAEGVYNKTNGFNNHSLYVDTMIKAVSGTPVISAENDHVWSLSDGQSHTYEASDVDEVFRVFDGSVPDSNGDYVELLKKTSIAEVETTAGSWWYDSGILYVRTFDDREPDSDIHGYLDVKQVYSSLLGNVFLDGLKIYGGTNTVYHVSDTINNMTLCLHNCELKYAVNGHGLAIGKSRTILDTVIAARNESDGFNYHTGGSSLEINCIGRNNGLPGDSTSNGSSIHDGGIIIRVNGEYTANHGPNLADVNANTKSWNLGCKSHGSLAVTNQCDILSEDGTMWVDSCKSYDSPAGLSCVVGALYVRNCLEAAARLTGGTIGIY